MAGEGTRQGFTSLLQVLSGQGDFSLDVLGLRFRERGFPDGGRFRGGGLLRSGVDGFQNQFHRAFQAVVGRVDAQVVEAGVAQLLPGVVQAVGAAAGIHEVHGFGCSARLHPVVFSDALHARGPVRMKEDAEQVGPPFQNEIGAEPHNDAGLPGRDVPDNFALGQEGGVFRWQFLRRVSVVLRIEFMQEAAGKLLFVLADVVRSKAALGGGQVDQFRVVELKAQPLRNHFADGMAAGAVFPVNGDDQGGVRRVSGCLLQRKDFSCGSGACQPFQQPVRPEDVPVEKTDDHAHQNGGHHGSFPYARQFGQEHEGAGQADADERAVHTGFNGPEFPFEEFDEGQAHAFRRQQNSIRLDLQKDAESNDGAAEQAEDYGPEVSGRFQGSHQPHGEVRQGAEDKDDGNLEQMRRTELPFQQGRLHGDKAQMHQDGDGSHRQRERQAEHIRRAGDGGDAQVGLGGQGDAQGHDEERHDQDEAAQDVFSNASPDVMICHDTGC